MADKGYYHLFANGNDALNFIISRKDFFAAFNRVGVCAHCSGAVVVSFTIQETHLHGLLFGDRDSCYQFKDRYEISSKRYIVATRGDMDRVNFHLEMYPVDSQEYLMNLGTYCVVQPTKDGKQILPFDYLWGSGPLYFRSKNVIPVWLVSEGGSVSQPTRIGDLSVRQKASLLATKQMTVPDEWLTCNGFVLPSNYVDVARFESIYQTANCYRTFMTAGRNKEAPIIEKMSSVRGITMDYVDAHKLCADLCQTMFGKKDARSLNPPSRLKLAIELRKVHSVSRNQLAGLVRLPQSEIDKFIL